MSPTLFVLLTFGVWTVVKGTAAKYWALATTPNASKGSASVPSTSTNVPGAASATGNVAAGLPPLPAIPAVPNVIGNTSQGATGG